ncbi:aminoacyl-histidine dipeptidase [Miniphocaeibacter massiliensis]|uniref:aminoacyl-histidine dipeptidase n=1 Tax=Miniphocaeibacter massiliensis TaxID=2041841 RepID=UPI000C1C064C|nr:aminoacyl-histidine dipeptidase [Miniphocaeibacter massiliensis]
MNNLSNVEPKEVMKWFYEINQHPRSSGNEKEISDFLVKFAKDRNLEVYQDEILNVIIKKPGTAGYENSEPVIIQGHMDMVAVKADDSNHNFDTDPIEMIVEDDIIRANKTTLGADDGIAVAFGLALLDSDEYAHPPIELLITTNEETGMDGVFALKSDHLSGTRLLNLDTEEEGVLLVSCSGGSNINTTFNIEKQETTSKAYELTISGLKGGHSGMEIIKQRANALKVLARLLTSVKNDIILANIEGGIKHNAIPSDAKATIAVNDFSKIEDTLVTLANEIKEEYRVEEPGFTFEYKVTECKETYTKELSDNIIDYLMILPDGVQYMSKDIEGLVQTSINNAIIGENNGKIEIVASVRSASASSLREILTVVNVLAKRVNAETKESSAYPAWEYEANSKLRDISIETFKEVYGKEPEISSIHAGLECGLLKGLLPNTDMISFGPAISGAHTPVEQMSISSVQRVWNYTKKLLENLK